MARPLVPEAGRVHPLPGQVPLAGFGALLPDLHPQELGRSQSGVPGALGLLLQGFIPVFPCQDGFYPEGLAALGLRDASRLTEADTR